MPLAGLQGKVPMPGRAHCKTHFTSPAQGVGVGCGWLLHAVPSPPTRDSGLEAALPVPTELDPQDRRGPLPWCPRALGQPLLHLRGCHELCCPIFLDLSTLGTLLRVNLAEREELLSCSCGVWQGTETRARVMMGGQHKGASINQPLTPRPVSLRSNGPHWLIHLP